MSDLHRPRWRRSFLSFLILDLRYPDLLNYKDGIYHHVTSSDSVSANPWEETNHAVVVVGWGVESATQEKYWIVKNSWGRHFGLTGYFYVRRSTDEIAIESMALSAGWPPLSFALLSH